jgi:hypothetical protein
MELMSLAYHITNRAQEQPCAYCIKKSLATECAFSAGKDRVQSASSTPNNGPGLRHASPPTRAHTDNGLYPARSLDDSLPARPVLGSRTSPSPTMSRDDHQGSDTVVPLEGRILRDAQGKVIFIGDCAPLSFLQTVRHLISSELGSEAFAAQAWRASINEAARPDLSTSQPQAVPTNASQLSIFVDDYVAATSGLADLFDYDDLRRDIQAWSENAAVDWPNDSADAVYFLVLAIGSQENDTERADSWFDHARNLLLKHMCNSMNVATVQGFTLVAVYMLRAFQPNGAYLYFSLAARTAYAIGIHRTEVNASFGSAKRRDRIWKSLRVVDMLISTVLGRPPSTSDVDCTVKYSIADTSEGTFNVLDPSVQIFMIIERVVVEVYSRKRISIRIADHVSRQLKGWASQWLQDLTKMVVQPTRVSRSATLGACSTLCSYYYGIMLLTRPFLMYEIYEHLGISLRGGGTQNDHRQKRKYADAALDAATTFVETLQAVIDSGLMPYRMPLIVYVLDISSAVILLTRLGHGSSLLRSFLL